MLREIRSRIKEPFHLGLRDTVLAQINSGKLTEGMELSSVLDSLDTVQLTMEIEELGIEPPTVPIKSVGDLLWLFKAIDLKRELGDKGPPQAP
jgi:acyl carrier protein